MSGYLEPRPAIPRDVRRSVEVESGHSCGIARCGEHTYLEMHHINEDRADNRVANLILLCDKHHKMAHKGIIDRKSLQEYKRLLRESYTSRLNERIERLESLLDEGARTKAGAVDHSEVGLSDGDLVVKSVASRSELMGLTIEQLAIRRFEMDSQLLFERRPLFRKGNAQLSLHAVRQDDSLAEDVILSTLWLDKRYLDGPVWVQQIVAAVAVYEEMTGREARGVLLVVVPKESMSKIEDLEFTARELEKQSKKPEVVIYTYDDLRFDPGGVSCAMFAVNLNSSKGS